MGKPRLVEPLLLAMQVMFNAAGSAEGAKNAKQRHMADVPIHCYPLSANTFPLNTNACQTQQPLLQTIGGI